MRQLNTFMRFDEFGTQTKTPDQLRLDSLKATKERAANAMATERQRQQVAKASKKLAAANQIKPASPLSSF